MNDANEWTQWTQEWRTAPIPPGHDVHFSAARVRARRRAVMIWLAFTADCLVALYATVISLSHRSGLGFTLAIIAWSIVIPIAAHFVSSATNDEFALDTATHLASRLSRVRRAAQMLEFSRVLVGVEVIISAGFWIAIRHSQGQSFLAGALAIAALGAALYVWLLSAATSAKQEQRGLEAISKALD